jgi:hypothetical protein
VVSIWVHSARRPLNGLLYLSRVIMKMENLVEWRLAEETEVLGENLPSVTLSTTNPTWPDPGANPDRRGGKPVTHRLSYGAALNMYIYKALSFTRRQGSKTRNQENSVLSDNCLLTTQICKSNYLNLLVTLTHDILCKTWTALRSEFRNLVSMQDVREFVFRTTHCKQAWSHGFYTLNMASRQNRTIQFQRDVGLKPEIHLDNV